MYRNYVLAAAIVLSGIFAALTIAVQPEILYGFEGDSGANGCGNGAGGGFGGGSDTGGSGGEGNQSGGAECGRWICRGGDVGCLWEPQACPPPPPPPPPPPTTTSSPTDSTPEPSEGGSQPCYDAYCTAEDEADPQGESGSGFFGDGTNDDGQGVIIGDEEPEVHPELSIAAVPLLVHAGESSVITWSSEDTLECAVEGPNFSATGTSGTDIAHDIFQRSTYTLTCSTEIGEHATSSVVVSIIPVFEEQ